MNCQVWQLLTLAIKLGDSHSFLQFFHGGMGVYVLKQEEMYFSGLNIFLVFPEHPIIYL